MNEDFLKSLSVDGTNIEYISITNKNVTTISEYNAKHCKSSNIYFLTSVNPNLVYNEGVRAKDADIVKKSYFCIDIDIRSNYKKENIIDISNEDIITEGMSLANGLKEVDEYFGEWSYIVYTGNGLHIYYVSDPLEYSVDEYKIGVSRIFRKWDELMGSEIFKSDHSCCNIGRILRLPGSINQKNGQEVKIIASQNIKSRLVDYIKGFAKKELIEIKEKEEADRKEIELKLQSYNKDDRNIYYLILTIPARQIAQLLIPEFPYDGKKNFKNKVGGFTGYYYSQSKNVIINGGSRYFAWGNETSGRNNFELIKRFKGYTNKETFSFYKQILNINK